MSRSCARTCAVPETAREWVIPEVGTWGLTRRRQYLPPYDHPSTRHAFTCSCRVFVTLARHQGVGGKRRLPACTKVDVDQGSAVGVSWWYEECVGIQWSWGIQSLRDDLVRRMIQPILCGRLGSGVSKTGIPWSGGGGSWGNGKSPKTLISRHVCFSARLAAIDEP